MSDSIKVAIKVRPLIKREKDDNLAIQWVVQENSIISTDPEMKRRGDGGFTFDHIFDMNASNSDVFNTVVKPIVNAAVNGFNGTVFAYGQTSSGKTYTMMGIEEEPGIVPLAVQHMFDAIANTMGREFLLRVSYLEIYNERVNDLLNKSGTDLKLKEDGSGQVVLQCKEEITNCPENVLSIMKKGDKKRRIGETNMNERSSRSHTIFRITIESRETGGDSDSAIQVSQLNLVDLAGSERARQTGATGERFKEGRHINMSLSTLGLVIMQLSESQDGQKHVNFRDSKLTRLLQSSLGGNAMTAIICAVTPAALEETQCTLSFASRAKSVRNKPQINEVMSDAALLKRYAKQLSKLQEELQRIKNENRSAEVEEMESKLQEKERINQLLEERIELLKTRIVSGDNISQDDSIKRKSKRRQTWGGPGIFKQHLPTFQPNSGLPTIKEVSFEKPQRKSIIQSMDIMNQTFQTAFADFELELFESERDRECRETVSDSDEESFVTKHKNRVTFRDDVSIKSKNNSFDVTPEKCNMFTQTIDYQASPSTPKHVLRRCITDLTREFVQLREFTTLEKQLICQENHCHAQEEEEHSLQTDLKETEQMESLNKAEYIPEVKEQLACLNLTGEENLDHIITELCIKLNEIQKQNISAKQLHLKTLKQLSELEKVIENITSERNEYEYMSCELRAELKKRTAELELKIMSEENTKQEEMKKMSEIEKQIETTISEKNEFERINAELTKKLMELQKQIENVTSERNEFEHMRRELHLDLNKKSLELEKLKNNSKNTNIELVNNEIMELETKVENITHEKDKFKQMNDDLRDELNCISSEFESKITSEQTEKQKAIEKVSELEKYIEQIISNKIDLERDNIEMKSKLNNKIECEQILNQKVLEFEKQVENIISEKNEIEGMNIELNKNVLELKSTILSQQTVYQETNEKISEFQEKLENVVSEKSELQRINLDLQTTLNQKCSDLEEKVILKETENLKALEKISEFEKQIMNITFEKKELERINNELHIEMEQKVSKQEERIITAQNENQKVIEKVSDLETQIESLTSEKDKCERIIIELRSQLNAKISEFEEELENPASEKSELQRVNIDLHTTLNQKCSDLEEKVISKETENLKALEKISEFEKQIMNITFEKKELERINNELHIEMEQKVSKQEERIITAQNENQKVIEKVSDLETQIESLTSEKDKCERIIIELRSQLNAKISEFEEELENPASEKSELQRVNIDLHTTLNQKCSDLEEKVISKETENLKALEKISEFEKQIMNITFEKKELERINNELHIEMKQKFSEQEAKIIAAQSENQKVIEKISDLEIQIESITLEKDKCERIIIDLRSQLNVKISDLDSYIISNETNNRNIMGKISQLENQVTSLTSEKDEFEHINNELRAELKAKVTEQIKYQNVTEKICELKKQIANTISEKNELCAKLVEKTSALKTKIQSEEIENQKVMEMIAELEVEVENITFTKDKFEYIITELRVELDKRDNTLESERNENKKLITKISELNKQIEYVILERNKFEHLNNQLNSELKEKTSELESKIMSEQNASLEAIKSTSKNNKLESTAYTRSPDIKNSELKLKSECDCVNKNNNLKNYIEDLQNIVSSLQTENHDLKDQLRNYSILSSSEMDKTNADTSYLILNMETQKYQLEESLQLKSQELEDIRNDVRSLTTDIKKLEETIYLLTTENTEMATKLTMEQENAKQTELYLQKTIEELYARISEVTNEKITLSTDLATLNDQLNSMRSKMSVMYNEEQLLESYESKIDKLTTENIELSTSITEKKKELENIKESKSLLYDHDCIYKEKIVTITEKNDYLLLENSELSTDLIDKIEENDMLKEQCNILKSKIEQLLAMNENVTGNDMEHLKMTNNTLNVEIAELKTKVSILSEENAKFSSNLLETIDNLDSSQNEKSCNNSLHLSKINNSTDVNETEQKISQKETFETLTNKVITLQNKVDYLVRLNKKLSDLKLTSCSQCEHLRNLNESRRALKFEAKALNQKLEDLQRKFDRKCADTEILKNKISQELNSSEHDESLDVTFVNEMNVSFVEARIESLNDELQTLKIDHDKLLVLYEDKCDELKQLQTGVTVNTTNPDDSTSRKSLDKTGNRIEQIQNCIDHLKNDMDKMMESSKNFTAILNQAKSEKANLLDEINSLKDINEELQQKILSDESMGLKKIQILENELTNMSSEIEQFSTREKGLETQRLILEVELESLRVEEQNKNILINQLNERVISLKNELDLVTGQKNELINSSTTECKEKELQYLRKQCEELEKQKIQFEELVQHNILKIKDLEVCTTDLQRNLSNQEYFHKELQEKNICLEKLLQEREEEKYILTEKLQTAETEIINFKDNFELKHHHQQQIKEYENNMQKLNDTLNKYINENLSLTQELADLKSTKEKFNELMAEKECVFDQQKMLVSDNEKLNEELYDIRKCMIKELKSLKCNVDMSDISSKSVNEMFKVLLQTLVSKEEEVIKTMQEAYERKLQKVEEEKQQCIDTEKRALTWIKELEAEIEKLQTELSEQERAHKDYQNKISQLDYLLNESTHENEMFKEKIQALETDFNNLQNEFEKQCKVDSQQEEAIFIAQKREKKVQEIFKDKEVELQLKFKFESEMYEQKINNLVQTIESYKSKNLMLNNTINELEVNEKQLKGIIETNSIEIKRNNKNVEKINVELEQLKQSYNEVNQEMEQKNLRIEEITAILKGKCDMLSEYTIKLKTIVPEYEMLKEHVNNKKLVIERCKEEIEILKKDREDQLEIIKEKLNLEEIKSANLSKQLSELNNKNIVLIEELNSLKEKYEELQEANAKLERKIRNSTSKIKAEAEIEELKELNKRLQNNLEGASNRVTEFQEIKNRTLKELVDIQGKYELVLQENNELRKSFSLYKSKHSNSDSWVDEGKYDVLLLEKNKIALELEDKKVMLNQKDKEVKEYVSQIQQLTTKNKELDEELEEYAAIIRERDTEISKLEDKLYSHLSENLLINEAEGKLKSLNEENEKLRDQVEALKMRLQMDVEGDVKLQNENIIRALQKENLELQTKLSIYKKQIDCNHFKELDQLKSLDNTSENDLGGSSKRVKELEGEKYRIVKELEAHKLLLSQKDKELAGYINQIRDLTIKNKELDNELEEYATTIRSRDAEISKLETNVNLCSVEDESVNNMKQQLESLTMENKKLKNEIRELQMLSRNEIHSDKDIVKDSKRRQYKSIRSDKDINEYESKCDQLEKKIHDLELQLVSKNGKIATLEIQIQSENFPYQRKCKELEEVVLAFRNKNAELSNEVRKLRKTVNDVNTWECDVCRRWCVNRKDQACQTVPNNAVRFCSTNSGVVEDHVKIQKLEKEKMLMKDLCRSRFRQIKELQDRLKELEEAQNSLTLRTNEVLQDRSNEQDNNATKFKRHLDVGKNFKS